MYRRLTPSTGLGKLVMYSLDSHYSIGYGEFQNLVDKYGVNPVLVPSALSDMGAFQRATTWVASNIVLEREPIICKEIECNANQIVRTFERRIEDSIEEVEEMADGKKSIPMYEHVATMKFDRHTGDIDYFIHRKDGGPIVHKALDRFNKTKSRFNIQQIRKFVQNAFKEYGSIKLRNNGGVNFIPATYEDEFNKFLGMCGELEGVDLVVLDIHFSNANRSAICEALDEHVNSSLEEEIKNLNGKSMGSKALTDMIADFSLALKESTVGKAALHSMVYRFQDTIKLVRAYQELLQVDLDNTEKQIEVANEQITSLLEKVSEEAELA